MQGPSPFIFTPTRRSQPYRAQQPRQPSAALGAMQAGRTLFGQNPMDLQRQLQAAKPGSLWWHLLNLSPVAPTITANTRRM